MAASSPYGTRSKKLMQIEIAPDFPYNTSGQQ
jgi:hypothetical protein